MRHLNEFFMGKRLMQYRNFAPVIHFSVEELSIFAYNREGVPSFPKILVIGHARNRSGTN